MSDKPKNDREVMSALLRGNVVVEREGRRTYETRLASELETRFPGRDWVPTRAIPNAKFITAIREPGEEG